MIKSILSIVALCAVIALVSGCSSNKTTSPGAMSDSKCCAEGKASTCTKETASPGAVGDKAECQKVCPMSGKTSTPASTEASPGAVSDAKPGCCKSKASTCTGAAKVDG